MKPLPVLLALLLGMVAAREVWANATGAELVLLSMHVQTARDANPKLYQRRLDEQGQYVVTPGVELYHDWELAQPVWAARFVRLTGAEYEDSVLHRAGYVAVTAVWTVHRAEPWEVLFMIGPGLIFRESWRNIPGYKPDNPLDESKDFLPGYEYKFLPLGSFDLLYRISPAWQAVWSIFPGIPYVITHNLGVRWTY